jgi:uncharacterized membrane protein YcaP (DUF421 family)
MFESCRAHSAGPPIEKALERAQCAPVDQIRWALLEASGKISMISSGS